MICRRRSLAVGIGSPDHYIATATSQISVTAAREQCDDTPVTHTRARARTHTHTRARARTHAHTQVHAVRILSPQPDENFVASSSEAIPIVVAHEADADADAIEARTQARTHARALHPSMHALTQRANAGRLRACVCVQVALFVDGVRVLPASLSCAAATVTLRRDVRPQLQARNLAARPGPARPSARAVWAHL
jgi:hypothetical protein